MGKLDFRSGKGSYEPYTFLTSHVTMPRQRYKNHIQKDTNTFLEATLLLAVLFDDDDENQEKGNMDKVGEMECDDGEIGEEEVYEICEVLTVALPHIRYLAPRVQLMRGHDFWEWVS